MKGRVRLRCMECLKARSWKQLNPVGVCTKCLVKKPRKRRCTPYERPIHEEVLIHNRAAAESMLAQFPFEDETHPRNADIIC